MRAMVKSVNKIVKMNKSNKWGCTAYNVLCLQHTTHAFLIWHVQAHVSAIVCVPHPGLALDAVWKLLKTLSFMVYKNFL